MATLSGAVFDIAGNSADLAMPNTPSTIGPTISGIITATAAGFGSTSATAPSLSTTVRQIPITFNGSVTGVTLSQLRLSLTVLGSTVVRQLSLTGATLSATGSSGTTYMLTLPSTLATLRGLYRLDIGGSTSSIGAGAVNMSTVSSIYWRRA